MRQLNPLYGVANAPLGYRVIYQRILSIGNVYKYFSNIRYYALSFGSHYCGVWIFALILVKLYMLNHIFTRLQLDYIYRK